MKLLTPKTIFSFPRWHEKKQLQALLVSIPGRRCEPSISSGNRAAKVSAIETRPEAKGNPS